MPKIAKPWRKDFPDWEAVADYVGKRPTDIYEHSMWQHRRQRYLEHLQEIATEEGHLDAP